jgi:nitrite reductase/ring-hydroxylating ferredoxin subunit
VGNGAVFVRSLAHEEGPFPEIAIATTGELAPGTWKVFRYPNPKTPAILVRRENGEHIAFLQKCPHLACPVSYKPAGDGRGERLECRCHNGRFDLATGKGTHGPPRELRPLRQVVLRSDGDRLFATGLIELKLT